MRKTSCKLPATTSCIWRYFWFELRNIARDNCWPHKNNWKLVAFHSAFLSNAPALRTNAKSSLKFCWCLSLAWGQFFQQWWVPIFVCYWSIEFFFQFSYDVQFFNNNQLRARKKKKFANELSFTFEEICAAGRERFLNCHQRNIHHIFEWKLTKPRVKSKLPLRAIEIKAHL